MHAIGSADAARRWSPFAIGEGHARPARAHLRRGVRARRAGAGGRRSPRGSASRARRCASPSRHWRTRDCWSPLPAAGSSSEASPSRRRRCDRAARRARGHGGPARSRTARVARELAPLVAAGWRSTRSTTTSRPSRSSATSSSTTSTTRRSSTWPRARRSPVDRERRRAAVRLAQCAALVPRLAAPLARDRGRRAASAPGPDRGPPGRSRDARGVDRPRARAARADESRSRAGEPRSTRTATGRAAPAATQDLNGSGAAMSQRSLEDAIQAAGESRRARTQLADRPVRVSEGARPSSRTGATSRRAGARRPRSSTSRTT